EIEAGRELLETRLVHERLDQVGVGHHEAKRPCQAIAKLAYEQELAVLLVIEHRRLRLCFGEAHQHVHLCPGSVPGVHPVEGVASEAGEAGWRTAGRDYGAGNTGQPERPHQVRSEERRVGKEWG